MIGLVVACLVAAGFYFKRRWTEALSMILVPIALAPVLLKITNVLGSDTYLPVAALSLPLFLVLVGSRVRFNFAFPGIVALALLFQVGVRSYVHAWNSKLELFSYAYATESTPFNAIEYANELLVVGELDRALSLALAARAWQPGISGSSYVISNAVYKKYYPDPTRIRSELGQYWEETLWFNYVSSVVDRLQEQNEVAYNSLDRTLASDRFFYTGGRQDIERIFASLYEFCVVAHPDFNCKKTIRNSHRRWLSSARWNQDRFREYVRDFGLLRRFEEETI